MRFEVPQFTEIEDKIFGPFTWMQFVYLGGGVGFALAMFLLAPFFAFVLFGLPVCGIGLLLAFYPINNRPFSAFLESFVQYLGKAKLYLWRKNESDFVYQNDTREIPEGDTLEPEYIASTSKSNSLSSLSRRLELKALQKER